jgi:hypothetical protein
MSALDSRASGVDAVRGFFDLFLAGKVDEAAQKYLANDFVLVNLLPDPIPFGGRYEGAAGFERYVSQIFAAIEMESFVVDAIFGQGESVAVIGSGATRWTGCTSSVSRTGESTACASTTTPLGCWRPSRIDRRCNDRSN